MTTHTLLQFTGISIAYMCIMLLLPWVMFRRILRGRRVAEQFLLCYTFGNFYIIIKRISPLIINSHAKLV